MMNNTKKEIESLKTEVASLKIRIRRIEDYLLNIPDSQEYIHESDSDKDLLEEAKKVVVQYDRASASLLQRRLSIGYARAARLMDELERQYQLQPQPARHLTQQQQRRKPWRA